MLIAAMRDPDPVLFCEPLRGYRSFKSEVSASSYTTELSKMNVVREGRDVTLIGWSATVDLALRAADVLAIEGIQAGVVDVRSLLPLDVDGLVKAVERTGRCIVIHEAPLTAGFGAEIAATLASEAFYSLQAPIQRITAPDAPYPLAGAEQIFLPGVEQVVAAARRSLEA
jgi:pyruvate dehydrogenase E1 component beta subunit